MMIILALLPFSDPSGRLYMGATFWLFVALIYLSISSGYAICLMRKIIVGLFPLQVLAQGIALLVLPLGMGAPYGLSWIGLAMSFAGTIALLHKVTSALRPKDNENDPTVEKKKDLSKEIPLPSLDIDLDGNILSVNEDMTRLLDVNEELLLGQSAESIFPEGMDRVEVGGKGWRILRKTLDESQLVCLVEEIEAPEASKKPNGNDMTHGPTGLFSNTYADIMAPSEIKRSIRYRRWLSIVMIRLSFRYDGGETADKTWEEQILNEYGTFVKRHIRECDLGFFIGGGYFLILLPETPNAGAKVAASKLKKLPDDIRDEIEKKGSISAVIFTSLYHCSGNEKVDYHTVMKKLEENLTEEEEFSPVGNVNTANQKTEGPP
ncbi:hypothetical protein [Dethiosulfovibrio faecalis]|uniref:hypothetical protein n=1 Tax=Dethiosulfovibrio faecalis TaxID=2720018 RepID=UPI001F215BBF|nr:hypothetical protein [Dethiosulfovibrio faecalis]